MSNCPSPLMSLIATLIGAASVPVAAPKRTVLESTVVASKPFTLKIATLMSFVLFGFIILLASFLGLTSTETNFGPRNSTAPISQTPARRFPS